MISAKAGAKADILLNDGDMIKFGDQVIEARSTPGHTDGEFYVTENSILKILSGYFYISFQRFRFNRIIIVKFYFNRLHDFC